SARGASPPKSSPAAEDLAASAKGKNQNVDQAARADRPHRRPTSPPRPTRHRHVANQARRGDGITFQQVQKYERGTNRIAPSRLIIVARLTGKPVEWFYGEAGQEGPRTEVPTSRLDFEIARAAARLQPKGRRAVLTLINLTAMPTSTSTITSRPPPH